jgi:hypothetical protein
MLFLFTVVILLYSKKGKWPEIHSSSSSMQWVYRASTQRGAEKSTVVGFPYQHKTSQYNVWHTYSPGWWSVYGQSMTKKLACLQQDIQILLKSCCYSIAV